jgi:ABC-2 type transport system permease protein
VRMGEVFRYEIGYRLRSGSTWIYAAFLFLIMCWGTLATANGSGAVLSTAPQRIAEATVLFGGLFGLVVSAALFGDAAVRDVAVGMDPLVYTTRITKREYLFGRFLAALAVNALVVLALPLGHMFATVLPLMEKGAVGPFRLLAYVQPLLLFTLPNLVLIGVILFAVGALTRQVIPVFLTAIVIFIGYLMAANYWHSVDNPLLSALGDPLGINALSVMHELRAPAQENVELIGFPSILLWNRVLWLTVAAILFALVHRRFRFAHSVAGQGLLGNRKAPKSLAVAQPQPFVAIPRVSGMFDFRARVWQTLAVARRTFGDVMAGYTFRVILVGIAGCVLLMGWNVTDTVFETNTWPVTQLVAGTVISRRISIIPWVIIILFAGELVWKEREVRAAEIADAVPLPNGIALMGRFLALVGLIAAMLLASMVGGILMQTLQGYFHFELGLYAQTLFGFDFPEFVLLAALAMTVHVLINHKYVGHIVALSLLILTKAASGLGFRHHLLVYNTDPGWQYSVMNGFGPFPAPYAWFKSYWAAWALLLMVLATLFWVRGHEPGLRRRFALARSRFVGPVARTAGVAVALIVALGGFVFYNTNVLNDYHSADDAGAPQADYEKRYGVFAKVPQPMLADAKLRVEIYPGEPAVVTRGAYRLVNKTSRAIDSVHLYLNPRFTGRSFSFDRGAKAVLTDEQHGYRIYALDRALAPRDSLTLTFEVEFRQRGFKNSGLETDVVGNGAYFDRRWFPFIGYQPVFELTANDARKRFGLPPKSMPGPDDVDARQQRGQVQNEDLVHVETIIGTVPDQTPVSFGTLRRSWMENGRRYVDYETDGAVPFAAPIYSARYAEHEEKMNGVTLEIFHHPSHAYNLPPIVHGMKAALEYYTTNYGPYPFHELRIVEIPPYSVFGHADPGTIAFSEDVFFSRSKPGELDQAFYGTAHEVAHQWQVAGAPVRGRGFLSESFANYNAVMVTEKTYGIEGARRAYRFHMERYLLGRAQQSREVPVLAVESQPYIMYRKGAIALYTLRDFLGEDTVNAALRRYLDKYRDAGAPYPTALDEFAELRAVTPDSLKYLLTDLFETITLWDVKTERASVRATGKGQYEVTLDVVAKKTRADSTGREVEVPMNDLVDIGVFAADGAKDSEQPLYLQRHRIRSGKQTITISVSRKPVRAGVDPYDKLIDRDRDDNVAEVH